MASYTINADGSGQSVVSHPQARRGRPDQLDLTADQLSAVVAPVQSRGSGLEGGGTRQRAAQLTSVTLSAAHAPPR